MVAWIYVMCIPAFAALATTVSSDHVGDDEQSQPSVVGSLYDIDVTDIQGNQESMSKYRGKVLLVVNVASECGYTNDNYKALAKLYGILGNTGKFTVLAFPCNQFGDQEPGDEKGIEYLARIHYKATFPMHMKTNVIGSNAHPVFKYLAVQTNQAPDWNFWKYLVDVDGKVLNAWGPQSSVSKIFDVVKAAVDKANSKDAEQLGSQDAEQLGSQQKDEL